MWHAIEWRDQWPAAKQKSSTGVSPFFGKTVVGHQSILQKQAIWLPFDIMRLKQTKILPKWSCWRHSLRSCKWRHLHTRTHSVIEQKGDLHRSIGYIQWQYWEKWCLPPIGSLGNFSAKPRPAAMHLFASRADCKRASPFWYLQTPAPPGVFVSLAMGHRCWQHNCRWWHQVQFFQRAAFSGWTRHPAKWRKRWLDCRSSYLLSHWTRLPMIRPETTGEPWSRHLLQSSWRSNRPAN